jgi:hypothetical protein
MDNFSYFLYVENHPKGNWRKDYSQECQLKIMQNIMSLKFTGTLPNTYNFNPA